MRRCCGGGSNTAIQAGSRIRVSGSGSSQDPFVIDGDVGLEVTDTSSFNLTLEGLGTLESPWGLRVEYAPSATLNDIPDVDVTGATNGQVLARNVALGRWVPQNPTTSPPGAVSTDASLSGDGSAGSPLGVTIDPDGYLAKGATGVGMPPETVNQLVRQYGSSSARSLDPVAPELNAISMLDTAPGVMWYWTGSQHRPVNNGIERAISGELLALSGGFATDAPIAVFVKQLSEVTDEDGLFDVLSTADLTGRAGVVYVSIQETGTVPYKAMVTTTSVDRVTAVAHRLDDGTPYASQAVTATVFAVLY